MEQNKEYCSVTGKVCLTEKEAGTMINKLKSSWGRKRRNHKVPRRKYFCRHCKSWHTTSMNYFKGGRYKGYE